MYKIFSPILILLLFYIPGISYSQPAKGKVKTGIEVLTDLRFEPLLGKRVGLITNPTGVNASMESTIDILFRAPGVELVALFGPEHGVRGDHDAGETVYSRNDPLTGLPVYSLYGKTRKPNPDMLKGIDILIYDIQDIGCRSYTYISTMGLAMEAAAEQGIPFMVLDRPNPLGGNKIEGPLAKQEYFSMVGAYPIPYVYGLSCGELARMINEEGWLRGGVKCQLQIIPMEGWKRNMYFEDTGLQWVPSSPHIPSGRLAPYYVATGILGELGVFNIGVGYTLPFELIGHENINPDLLTEALNECYSGKVIFRPIHYKPYYGTLAGKVVRGFQLYILEPEKVELMSIQFRFLEKFHEVYPNIDVLALCPDRHSMFDKVNGGPSIRELFFVNYRYDDIRQLITDDAEDFKRRSARYHLYQ